MRAVICGGAALLAAAIVIAGAMIFMKNQQNTNSEVIPPEEGIIPEHSTDSADSAEINPPASAPAASLKDVYTDDFLMGSAVAMKDMAGSRLDLLKRHFNVITAENAMKPNALQPSQGKFTFDGADLLIKKAIEEGMAVHGHNLCWHEQTPAWMNTAVSESGQNVPLDRETALRNLTAHADTVVRHFSEKFNTPEKQNIISWDVVNEAMNDNPSHPADWKASLRGTPWLDAVGPDYIEEVFLSARRADPRAMLYYNDYGMDNPAKAQAVYNMVKDINERHPDAEGRHLIDGVGMQGHYSLSTNPENVKASLEKFISLGVEVSISEMDIQAGANSVLSEEKAIAQGLLYARLFEIFKEHSAGIARVTFWGLNDSASWRAPETPLLFDKDLQAKPAFDAVMDPEKFLREYSDTP